MTALPQGVVWFVSAMLVEAAVIDGRQLRVPNWLTFPMALGGLAYAAITGGTSALLMALAGAAVGLVVLMPLHMIGGMGAGDVKLMAAMGAWVGPWITLGAFVATGVVGGLMALVMILRSGEVARHLALFRIISREVVTVRDPVRLSELAAERKPTMTLLPYGIPIAIGSIGYFAWLGLFF